MGHIKASTGTKYIKNKCMHKVDTWELQIHNATIHKGKASLETFLELALQRVETRCMQTKISIQILQQ